MLKRLVGAAVLVLACAGTAVAPAVAQDLKPRTWSWAGSYSMDEGTYRMFIKPTSESQMLMALLPTGDGSPPGIEARVATATRLFAGDDTAALTPGEELRPIERTYTLQTAPGEENAFDIVIDIQAAYVIFLEYPPPTVKEAIAGSRNAAKSPLLEYKILNSKKEQLAAESEKVN